MRQCGACGGGFGAGLKGPGQGASEGTRGAEERECGRAQSTAGGTPVGVRPSSGGGQGPVPCCG